LTEPKATKPRASRAVALITDEVVKGLYRVEAKVDYGMEDVRSAVKRIGDDHEARIRGLEKSESQRQGGNSTARFLYGAVWPAVAFINSAISLYLTYKAMKP
jgi:hypothetical protein